VVLGTGKGADAGWGLSTTVVNGEKDAEKLCWQHLQQRVPKKIVEIESCTYAWSGDVTPDLHTHTGIDSRMGCILSLESRVFGGQQY
jgi:hypothetical protein